MAINNLLDYEREAPPAETGGHLERTGSIPPAFYRDAGEPPPGDPHWREWPNGPNREPVPRFLLIGVPLFLGVFGSLHILLILLVLRLGGLY
jgi:hypothetical protein